MNLAFFDIETTGFGRQYECIIELAAIAYNTDTNEEYEMFHRFLKPNKKIPKAVRDLTGITDSMVKDAPEPWDVLEEFFGWLKAYKIDKVVAHNGAVFDWPFIKIKCEQFKGTYFKEYPLIDTLKMARALKKKGVINPADCKQPTLATYFGFTYVPHTAIEDCRALAPVWKKLEDLTNQS